MKKTIIYLEEETILQLKYMGLDQRSVDGGTDTPGGGASISKRQPKPRKAVRR